jgi:hypothetical protein
MVVGTSEIHASSIDGTIKHVPIHINIEAHGFFQDSFIATIVFCAQQKKLFYGMCSEQQILYYVLKGDTAASFFGE